MSTTNAPASRRKKGWYLRQDIADDFANLTTKDVGEKYGISVPMYYVVQKKLRAAGMLDYRDRRYTRWKTKGNATPTPAPNPGDQRPKGRKRKSRVVINLTAETRDMIFDIAEERGIRSLGETVAILAKEYGQCEPRRRRKARRLVMLCRVRRAR